MNKILSNLIGYNLPDRGKLVEIAEIFNLTEIEYHKYKRSCGKGKKSD